MLDRMKRYRQSLDVAALVHGSNVTAHWMGDGSAFRYADGEPNRTVIFRVDPLTNTREPLLASRTPARSRPNRRTARQGS